ncbi:Uncharacterised protein [uncultured archaeon]|nr:Uncharacterised protein [uncultured archaeon]
MAGFNAIKKEIEGTLPRSPLKNELCHAKLVLKWLIKLSPGCGDAMKIAAFGHDIERAVTGITEKGLDGFSGYEEFKREHAKRSAGILSQMMEKHGFSHEEISRMANAVERHESGGNDDSNLLMEADSLAFMEYNIPFYLERNGREKALHKIRFMYRRLSEKGKVIVSSMNFKNKETSGLFNEALGKS